MKKALIIFVLILTSLVYAEESSISTIINTIANSDYDRYHKKYNSMVILQDCPLLGKNDKTIVNLKKGDVVSYTNQSDWIELTPGKWQRMYWIKPGNSAEIGFIYSDSAAFIYCQLDTTYYCLKEELYHDSKTKAHFQYQLCLAFNTSTKQHVIVAGPDISENNQSITSSFQLFMRLLDFDGDGKNELLIWKCRNSLYYDYTIYNNSFYLDIYRIDNTNAHVMLELEGNNELEELSDKWYYDIVLDGRTIQEIRGYRFSYGMSDIDKDANYLQTIYTLNSQTQDYESSTTEFIKGRCNVKVLNIREEPSITAKIVGSLTLYDDVEIINISDNTSVYENIIGHWFYIKTSEGKEGWVYAFYIDVGW